MSDRAFDQDQGVGAGVDGGAEAPHCGVGVVPGESAALGALLGVPAADGVAVGDDVLPDGAGVGAAGMGVPVVVVHAFGVDGDGTVVKVGFDVGAAVAEPVGPGVEVGVEVGGTTVGGATGVTLGAGEGVAAVAEIA